MANVAARGSRSRALDCCALLDSRFVNGLVEQDAVDVRYFAEVDIDGEARLGRVAEVVLADRPALTYAHLISPQRAGRAYGWASPQYIEALARTDAVLARLLTAAGDDCAVVVVGHGGNRGDYSVSRRFDAGPPHAGTLVVIRAARVEPVSTVSAADIVDIAPTVADVAGFAPPAHWSGRSLLGTERPTVDVLLDLVESMADHSYGEHITMAEHSLQAAANASAAEAGAELVAAALLHDLGHMLGPAGDWDLPSHAEAGADFLQALLPASVVEPIRLHVDAKRYLVATDAAYSGSLSEASRQSLALQGGAFSVDEAAGFEREPFAAQAVALRRFDDSAKSPGIHLAPVAHYRPLLVSLLSQVHHDARALRDSCVCPECRDATSGQRLLAATDLSGWHDTGNKMLGHQDGRTHHRQSDLDNQPDITPMHWRSDHRPDRTHSATRELAAFTFELSLRGLALATGLDPTPGSVLGFGRRLGFVRATQYGRPPSWAGIGRVL